MDMHDRIRKLRTNLGFTQFEFAERLEIAKPTVSAWERGQYSVPSNRINQICQTFNVSRTWLETGVGNMFGQDKSPRKRNDAFNAVYLELFKSLPKDQQDVLYAVARKIVELRTARGKR